MKTFTHGKVILLSKRLEAVFIYLLSDLTSMRYVLFSHWLVYLKGNIHKMTSETVRTRSVTKQLDSLRVPGMFLLTKFNSYKRQQEEVRRKVATEKELNTLHKKIVSIHTCP